MAYIASNLRAHGYAVTIIDAKQLMLKTHEVITKAVGMAPDLVGITAMTPDVVWAARIADGIKAALPSVPVVVGGAHINALPEETLREFSSFDIAVVGEGEKTMLELADTVEAAAFPDALSGMEGIAFRSGQTVVLNKKREYLEELDVLPFPAWDLFPLSKNMAYPIYATRGCPFGCNFCQRVLGRKVRRRSVGNVVAEIEWILDSFGASGFWFSDETFGANRKWTADLLDLMIERGIPARATWHAQTRVDLCTDELLGRMKRAGCDGVALGIESGNEEILARTGKNIRLEDAVSAVSSARRNGLKTRTFFILGHPFETVETIRDTIDFAARLNSDFVSFAVMVPYPGTEIWEMARRGEGGYSYVSENWDDYRKHLAAPVGFESIPARVLKNLDKKAYMTFYFRNRRWADFLRFVWGHRSSISAYLIKKIRASATRGQ